MDIVDFLKDNSPIKLYRLSSLDFKKFIKLKKDLLIRNSASSSLRNTMTLSIYTYKRVQIYSPYINLMTMPLILNKKKCHFIRDFT
jgi:hypothetical protein